MDAVRHKHSEVVAFLKRNGAVLHHDKAKGMLACHSCDLCVFMELSAEVVLEVWQHGTQSTVCPVPCVCQMLSSV